MNKNKTENLEGIAQSPWYCKEKTETKTSVASVLS